MAKKTLRIGALGLTHDHVWANLKELIALRDVELAGVADPHDELLAKAQKEFGCAVFSSAETFLMEEGDFLDAVLIFGDNAGGVDLAELAAQYGLHILIEKPMAADLAGADRMLAAVRNAGTRLMVNWPIAWWPQLQHALKMVEAGKIGRVWQTKYRAAHNGPREMGCSKFFYDWLYDPTRNGAGAFIDYCCYGALLSRHFMGMPSRVNGVAGRFCKEDIRVEDNGVLVMTYPNGMSLAEASWTQIGHLTSYVTVIYGTTGTLLIEPGGRLLMATAKEQDGVEIPVPTAKPHLKNASAHFIHCLRTGEEFHPLCNDRVARDAQEILEAGLLSSSTGSEISLPMIRSVSGV
ncbi:MAG TPA: Gfo/Idh/MocA family oxidoreductase [Roseimicrobium sp.]|nr:Gfo/Idh/MocA family oxidoreductase [Roseimicrobium sp.]